MCRHHYAGSIVLDFSFSTLIVVIIVITVVIVATVQAEGESGAGLCGHARGEIEAAGGG